MRSPIEEHERNKLFGGRESIDTQSHFIVRYRISPATGISVEEAGARILMITTLRTMQKLSHETSQQRSENVGSITHCNSNGELEIAIPLSYCSVREGLTHLFLLITAAAEYNYTETFWIDSIELPQAFVKRYQGPRFGVEGIRDLSCVRSRPLIGLVLKPLIGAPLSVISKSAIEALKGGADFIVDDLLLVDPDGEMSFDSRISHFAKMTQDISKETRERKLYFANICVSPHLAAEYAMKAFKAGVNGVMVDVFTMGIGGVEHVIDALAGKIPVIATNMGSGVMTRGTWLKGPNIHFTGMSEAVIAKLSRVAGVDAVHTGTSASECYGEDAWGPAYRSLQQQLHGMKQAMAVAEGDLTVANLWENIKSLGCDLLVEATSGIVNYPGGPAKGAAAFRLLANELRPEMGNLGAHQTIEFLSKRNSYLKEGLRTFKYTPPNTGGL